MSKRVSSFSRLLLAPIFFCSLLSNLGATPVFAYTSAQLVKDINTGQLAASFSAPTSLVEMGGVVYFTATDAAHGQELWKSDGTTAGTELVSDISPGTASSSPSNLTNINGTLFFIANDGTTGNELWKSDGTATGTVLVKDINTGSGNSVPSSFTIVNGTLFFKANDGTNGSELWKSDGTATGTMLVKDIYPGSTSSSPTYLTNLNATLFFQAYDPTYGYELWKSDGTAAGTVLVKDINPGSASSMPSAIINLNGTLFFSASDGTSGSELWKSDGTAAGTMLVKDINPGTGNSSPSGIISMNGTLFFAASDGTSGSELWKSDGTAAGTELVKDINPGTGNSSPTGITDVNGTLFFAASDGTSGSELWKSDGTANGTVRVKDIYPGSTSSAPTYLRNTGGTLFFTANDGTNGQELWKSDGTESGTVLVKDIYPGTNGSNVQLLTSVNGMPFFVASSGTGSELWKSDGTANGTVRIHDTTTGTGSSSPLYLTTLNGTLFFAANDGITGSEVWKSDGTTSGTVLVKDINPGTASSSLSSLTSANDLLFFEANDSVTGYELWKSDGTANGTVLVKDIRSGITSSMSSSTLIRNVNNTLFFAASDGITGSELWKSDGTPSGTMLVKDIYTGGGGSSISNDLTNVNGTLFFTAFAPNINNELWKSDGTENGTVLVKDIYPGASGSYSAALTNMNGTLFFETIDPTYGGELWKSDGTTAGTVIVKDINPGTVSSSPSNLTNVIGTLFFDANDGIHGRELWKSDGTESGTVLVKDIYPSTNDSNMQSLTNVNGTLYFVANDGMNGLELWMSDGTASGTVLVKDIFPGSKGSALTSLTSFNNLLFFVANDGVHGEELWQSDGTAEGTMMVADIYPGSGGSLPQNLHASDDALYFTAYTQEYGRELWKLPIPPTLVLSPVTSDFEPVEIGSSSVPRIITLTYTGATTLNVSSIQLVGAGSDQFILDRGDGSGNTCGNTPTLLPSQSCTVSVTFSPLNGGSHSVYLRVLSNDQMHPTLDATLTGATPQQMLTTIINGSGSVTASSSGYGNLLCSLGSCTQNYYSDAVVALTAAPSAGYSFTDWSGACSGTGNCSITMNLAQTVTASFADTTPPVTTFSPAGGIYTSGQSVSLACSDAGSGCTATYYCLVAGCTPATPYSSAIAIWTSADLRFYSTDTSGNVETIETVTYTIDSAPPVTSASPAGGTFNAAQNVTLTCSDSGSGCASTYYCIGSGCNPITPYSSAIAVPSSTDVRFYSRDIAGNSESIITAQYTIDVAPPTTTLSPVAGTYRTAQNVSLACSDGSGSGCASTYYCLGSGCDPTTPYSSAIAITSTADLSYYSRDIAGNSDGVTTVTYNIDLTPLTIRVPADQPTIQGAINAAINGDTVSVAPGTYLENLNFNGKAITVSSTAGADVTIIDGNQTGSVVILASGETTSSVLDGFTIRNGKPGGAISPYNGGGIYISNASPLIANNKIVNNTGCEGVGIYAYRSSATIRGNVIANNVRSGCTGGGGGGISVVGTGSAQILDNEISGNSVALSGHGGGINVSYAGTPLIRGNIIRGNIAAGISPCSQGGGIYVEGRDSAIVQNIISDNNAGCGGGVSIRSAQGTYLANNTIVENDALGSGLYFEGYEPNVLLMNNIIVGKSGQTGVYCRDTYDLTSPLFQNTIFFAPSGSSFGGFCPNPIGLNGNITADPLLYNAGFGKYYPMSGSPAIDAGDNDAPSLPASDPEGILRFIDGNNDSITTVDMGAFEYNPALPMAIVLGTPSGSTNNTGATMSVAGTDVVTYKYKLDAGSYSAETPVATPISLTALSEATHAVSVLGKDSAGNWQRIPTAMSWAVDLTPPIASVSGTPASPTSATGATLTVGGIDVVTYKYKLDTGSYSAETAVAAPISLTALSEATHTVSVLGKDSAGNWQVTPTTVSWSVDITPPTASVSGTPASPTNITTATLTIGGTGVVTYKYKLDAGSYSAETAVGTSISLTGLSDGTHTVSVIGKDTAGNWQVTPTTVSWTVDLPPVTTLTTNPAAADGANGWFVTTPTLTLTSNKPGTTYYLWGSATTGYNYSTQAQTWISGGTAQNIRGDDTGKWYSLPFGFSFFGTTYTNVYISSNGLMRFDTSDSSYTNSSADLKTKVAIAPLWDDLITSTRIGDDVYVFQPDQNSIAFRWQAVPLNTSYNTNFEAILYSDGRIRLNYGAQAGGLTPTIGISKGDGVNFHIPYNNNLATTNYMASILYTPLAWNTYTAAFTASGGDNLLSYYTVDSIGTTETARSQHIKVDTAAPVSSTSVAGGAYSTSQSVSLSCSDTGGSGCAGTWYCLGTGCTPTTIYSSAIPITSSTDLRFYSKDSAGNSEAIRSEAYVFPSPLTTVSPWMGTYRDAQNVILTCTDQSGSGCATTYYCLGSGCTPTTVYTGPVPIAASTTLQFYSRDAVGNSEPVRSYDYTIDPTLAYRFERVWPQSSQPWYFAAPRGIAVDANHFVYIADVGNHRIQKYDSKGNYVTAWGSYGFGNGQFNDPSGIAMDSAGNIYVADTFNHRIQKFTSSGDYVNSWGSYGSSNGQFNAPYDIKVDSVGNVYVADTQNNRIQKFTSNGNFVAAWGALGSGAGQFNWPNGIALDGSGYVYVSDTNNNRVQKFTSSGAYVSSWGSYGGGNGQFNSPTGITLDSSGYVYVADVGRIQKFTASGSFVATWGYYGKGDGQFDFYLGICIDSAGNIYVADSGNNRIQKYNSSRAFVSAWGLSDDGSGHFSQPFGITVDSVGNYYVADSVNNRVQKFDSSGSFAATWGTFGNGNGQFGNPSGITIDPAGNIYVVDTGNSRLQKFDASGAFVTAWGTYGSGNGQFRFPTGVAIDTAGNVYVADTSNNRIQKFDPSGTFVAAWGSPGSGNGQFDVPYGVAIDPADNIYIADTGNHRIQKLAADGTFVKAWGMRGGGYGQFYDPYSIVLDSSGNLYVTDAGNARIQKFTSNGDFITAWGSFGTGNGQFNWPRGITVGSAGDVYITDSYNNRIQKFSNPYLPGTPTNVYATAGNGQAMVSFTAPASDGGSPITSYTVTSNPGNFTATGPTSPITVTGLTNDTAYTFTVAAINAAGAGPASTASNSILIDTSAPNTAATPVGGTYTSSLNVTLTCTDDTGSGCAATYYCLGTGCSPATPYSGPISVTASNQLSYYSTDIAGNNEPVKTAGFIIDSIPPTTTPSPAGGSYDSAQSVSLACNDGSGSGCVDTYYCLGTGCSPTTLYTGPIAIDFSTDLRFYSADGAGNGEGVQTVNYSIAGTSGPELLYTGTPDQWNLTGNDVGEVVWNQNQGNGPQVYSNMRGQLTTSQAGAQSPAINNLGDVVWTEYNESRWQVRGSIAGHAVTLSSPNTDAQLGQINDRGEAVWSQWDYNNLIYQIFSNVRGQLVSSQNWVDMPAINNLGDVVLTQQDNTGFRQIYKLAAGSATPVAITSDPTDHWSPAINDNGEIIWNQMVSGMNRIVSSVRGQLSFSQMNPGRLRLDNCGNVIFTDWNPVTGTQKLYRIGDGSACSQAPERIFSLAVGKNLATSGTGQVSSSPAGITLGSAAGSAMAAFPAGSLVTLTATPDATSLFAGWSGACSGTGTCQVTMDMAKMVTAAFDLKPADTTPPVTTASPAGGTYTAPQTVTLTCSDDSGSGCAATNYCLGAGCTPTLPYGGTITVATTTYLRFSSVDNAGNSEAVRTESFLIDIVLPTASVSGVPASPSNATGATLIVGGTDVVAYRYKLDSGSYSAELPVATPIVLTGLGEGNHTVSVLGRDSAGNWQVVPTTADWSVDLPVSIPGGSGYAGIQTAYNALLSNNVIQLKATAIIENLIFNRNIMITLRGGYDPVSGTTSGMTTLHGSLEIGSGTVVVENLVITTTN